MSYIECSRLQWNVSVGAPYGFSELAIVKDNYQVILFYVVIRLFPCFHRVLYITDEIIVSNISEIL